MSFGILEILSSFQVDECCWSDHLPLNLKLISRKPDENTKMLSLRYKNKTMYAQKLEQNTLLRIMHQDEFDMVDLVDLVRQSVDKDSNRIIFKQPWYNCLNAKTKTLKLKLVDVSRKREILLDLVLQYYIKSILKRRQNIPQFVSRLNKNTKNI